MDIGEGFEFDSELLEIATSANISCGIHAGSEALTFDTVEKCLAKGVRVGLHPGYPDRDAMGRRPMELGQERTYIDSICAQIEGFCRKYEAQYLKPHGGFYNDLARPLAPGWDSMVKHPGSHSPYEAGGQEMSRVAGTGALTIQLRIHKLALMGLPGTYLEEIGRRSGFGFIKEGFADRRYRPDGTLAPRSEGDSVLKSLSEIEEQVVRLAQNCDSICIHGDTEGAVIIAGRVRMALEAAGYEVKS